MMCISCVCVNIQLKRSGDGGGVRPWLRNITAIGGFGLDYGLLRREENAKKMIT